MFEFWPRGGKESRFWLLGVNVGPLRNTSKHLGFAFWTSRSRFWVSESQFRASEARFLGWGRRILALVDNLRPRKVNFMFLIVELWILENNIWPLGVN